jgi:hypothetical protein
MNKQLKPQIVESADNKSTELSEMQKQISELQEIIKNMSKPAPKEKVAPVVVNKEISANEYIKVMSLCNSAMTLSTKPRGQGKLFNFAKFGDIKKMLYSELSDIINVHPNFLEAGYFYVLDKRAISELVLDDLYEKILNKDQILEILNSSPNAVDLFTSANDKQREIIVSFLIEKVRDGLPVDFNLVSRISEISGVKIVEKAEDAKSMMKFENGEK